MFTFCFLLSAVAHVMSAKEVSLERRSRATANSYVVSHLFCESSLDGKDRTGQKTLEEVHTYSELKHDPRASLPDSFTICSTIMTSGCQSSSWPTFFNILDDNRSQFLSPFHSHGLLESRIMLGFHEGNTELLSGKVPPLFPNQWTSSCLAVNATSGLIHWVVEGILVLTTTSMELKNNSKSRPKDLSRKLLLGAKSYGGTWFALTQKVTNLNIYSSPLPVEKMESMTMGGNCAEKGDYLAWEDMEWILHGHASKETVEKEDMCQEKPLVDVYNTPFPGMDSCMHHCQNLGTRVPSVATYE